MKVEIPVHPVSKKILMAEYGDKTNLGTKDAFYSALYIQRPDPNSYKNYQQFLTESVAIHINRKLARLVEDNKVSIGWFFWQLHADHMVKWVYAQTMATDSMTAKQAFRNFYDLYGIDEDDYSSDAAYKRWQRYMKDEKVEEMTSFFVLQRQRTVLEDGQLSARKIIPPTRSEISRLWGLVMSRCTNTFLKNDGQINQNLFKHLYIYTLVEFGQRSKEEVAESVGRSKKNINYSIEKFEELMATYPEVKKAYEWSVAALM